MSVATDRIKGVNASAALKVPCVAATTANITLSGLQTIDGVVLAAGDRVLVKDQTVASENGIYCASTSGWSRAPDLDGAFDIVSGTCVLVTTGSSHALNIFRVSTANPITIGTTSISFTAINGAFTGTYTAPFTGGSSRSIVTRLSDRITPFDFGAVGDGVTDDTTAVQNAINASSSLEIPFGHTFLVGELTVSSAKVIYGRGTLKANTAAGAFNLLEVTVGGCFFADFEVDLDNTDDSYASGFVADRNGIYVHGASNASKISGFVSKGVRIKNCGQSGTFMQYVEDVHIFKPNIQRCGQHGVRIFSGLRCYVKDAYIDNIYPGNTGNAPYLNAYGLTFSRSGSDDVCEDCTLEDAEIRRVTSWEGADTHYGKRIRFINVSTYQCGQGVAIQSVSDGFESSDIQVIGGTHYSFGQAYTRSGQTYEPGSAVVANMGDNNKGSGLLISGIQARGHGSGRDSSNGAISVSNAEDVKIVNNLLIDSLKRGISVIGDSAGITIDDNSIEGVTAVGGVARGIEVPTDFSGYVGARNKVTGAANQDIHPSEVVIASGAVTAVMDFHTIDTESGASSDDLDTINGGWTGRTIRIAAESSARTVVVKNGTGNIRCEGAADLTMNSENDLVSLTYIENNVWIASLVSV